jgi:Flp pilus assembly pilin Flp
VKWAVAQPWANRDGVKSSAAYRHLAALGATCNISMLMTINLLGFVTGVDGIFEFLSALLSSGSTFIALTLITFYSSAQVRNPYTAM